MGVFLILRILSVDLMVRYWEYSDDEDIIEFTDENILKF